MQNPTISQKTSQTFSLRRWSFAYIALALTLILSIVGIYIYSTQLHAATDIGNKRINLAGRQRALSQRMTKALLLYEKDSAVNLPTDLALGELRKVSGIFHAVITGFDRGGKVPGTDGKELFLPAVTDSEERKIIQDTQELWLPLYEQIKEICETKVSGEKLQSTVDMARSRNVPIFDFMNQLTNRTEFTAKAAISANSGPRNFLIALGSVAFFLIPGVFLIQRAERQRVITEEALTSLEHTYGELDRQAAELGIAQNETDQIMKTVGEGLFLIDEKGIIGDHHSKELATILHQEELAGVSLFGILQRHLSEKMYNTSRDFFTLLFDASRKEKTVLSVNPLTDLEINFPNSAGGFISRYVSFSFRRIMLDSKVERIFISLRDSTKQVELENKLRESEKAKERELEILLSIIQAPAEDLKGFIRLANEEIETINKTLRAEDFASKGGRNAALRTQLETVFRSVHNLNGNAALLQLTYFQKTAHAVETRIKELLDRPVLNGDDFLSIVVAQANLKSDLESLENLQDKLSGITLANQPSGLAAQPAPTSALAKQLEMLVTKSSTDQGKIASVSVDEFALHAFSHGRHEIIRDVLIQLTRNAVAHSVEHPSVRLEKGKSEEASISIHALPEIEPGVIGLGVRDNGNGLDIHKIRDRAISCGLLTSDQASSVQEIIQCIFVPGFSTTEIADSHSGRGMGMDIIKTKFVDEAGGCIDIISDPGLSCEFRLYLPI
jgi:two-component system, chemotaxis family, sensor kinase CheA